MTTDAAAKMVKTATSNHVPLNVINVLFARNKLLEQLGSQISEDVCFADDKDDSDADFCQALEVWNVLAPTSLAVMQNSKMG
jgi:hypothetical protein